MCWARLHYGGLYCGCDKANDAPPRTMPSSMTTPALTAGHRPHRRRVPLRGLQLALGRRRCRSVRRSHHNPPPPLPARDIPPAHSAGPRKSPRGGYRQSLPLPGGPQGHGRDQDAGGQAAPGAVHVAVHGADCGHSVDVLGGGVWHPLCEWLVCGAVPTLGQTCATTFAMLPRALLTSSLRSEVRTDSRCNSTPSPSSSSTSAAGRPASQPSPSSA